MPCGSLLSSGGVDQESVDAKKENKDYSKNKKDINDGVPPTFEEYWRYLLQNLPCNRSPNVSDL